MCTNTKTDAKTNTKTDQASAMELLRAKTNDTKARKTGNKYLNEEKTKSNKKQRQRQRRNGLMCWNVRELGGAT